ncbi:MULTISPECIES: hypothetical protein [unclassified Cryobacterium]|jgi:hypothetical protein|uniref:hypothetical protein n=1 Tax=unclassified Cryobacterium TaxID=2649013 RepID=UPI002AB3E77C|nr:MULTISPECIES: hypothetical protein [unclassified Cryobacterium]MDY7543159.1 hypothetical protein [Cryobacterium sp. 5B3]MEA9998844.1 hypothetical protein [Cryobacterium sp. RTS3]MEB0266711.1 hypothetical protein [Cryobacterium sp. 10I5]MEB0275552.1 hypothetical protein [Cryobacterium sp. 5B3]
MTKMTTSLLHVRVLATIALTLLGGTLLTGCTADAAQNAVNGAVQGATNGDVSLGGALPSGWPAEVPIVEGKILFAAVQKGDKPGWTVTVKATSTDPIAEATRSLTAAGFVAGGDVSATVGSAGLVSMKNDRYSVVVAGNSDGLLYTVTPVS